MNWIDRRRQKARRRLAGRACVGAGGAVVALFFVGLLLPADYTQTSSTFLSRSPETVWRVLTDLDGMPLWRSDLTAVERLPDLMGKPAWKELGPGGARVVELSLADPPRTLVVQDAPGGEGGPPRRTFELVSAAGGTRLTVTERRSSGNPIRRVLVRLNLPRPAIDRLMRDLTRRLTPRQVAAE